VGAPLKRFSPSLGRRNIPINVRTLELTTCILPVLTLGREARGVDLTSGVNRLQTILNQCLRRLVGVGEKAPWVVTTPLVWELGLAPIEAMAVAARSGAFLKAPILNTCISKLISQPSPMCLSTWTSRTLRWVDRFARASTELAQGVRVPHP
jgi:hypothetical protein